MCVSEYVCQLFDIAFVAPVFLSSPFFCSVLFCSVMPCKAWEIMLQQQQLPDLSTTENGSSQFVVHCMVKNRFHTPHTLEWCTMNIFNLIFYLGVNRMNGGFHLTRGGAFENDTSTIAC